jgi:hypothetical protein
MASVDLPAPRSPVRTREASESKTLAVEKSGECGGELGAEREAVRGRQRGWTEQSADSKNHTTYLWMASRLGWEGKAHMG